MFEVSCPRCNQIVDPQVRFCPHCGVDLAIAAVSAERDLTLAVNAPHGMPIAPEILVPRIGEYLTERGLLSPEDLQIALQRHRALAEEGHPSLIGQVLLELGFVDRETLDQIVTEQILKLQDALRDTNQQLERRVKDRTEELERALNKLSELNKLKSNFISNISHELRTPLTHLRGYLTLMVDGSLGPMSESLIEACNVMVRAETRLENLINDLIQFSLATKGELSLNLAPTSVSNIIYNALTRTEKLADARKVNVEVIVDGNLPLISVDGEKMTWVMLQLVDNAIKFTPQGGDVKIKASKDHDLVRVAVIDTGIGIASNQIDEIFEPFHQIDGSDTRHYGGVGLGLALVRQIIDAHGGQMRVQSEIGKGSTFEFILFAADATDSKL